MHIVKTTDGGQFISQNPFECAQSIKNAFPDPSKPITSQGFMNQVKQEMGIPVVDKPEANTPAVDSNQVDRDDSHTPDI